MSTATSPCQSSAPRPGATRSGAEMAGVAKVSGVVFGSAGQPLVPPLEVPLELPPLVVLPAPPVGPAPFVVLPAPLLPPLEPRPPLVPRVEVPVAPLEPLAD